MGNKIYKWVLSIVIIGFIGIIVFISIDFLTGVETKSQEDDTRTDDNLTDMEEDEETEDQEIKELSQEKEQENKDADYINPFGDTFTKKTLEESQYQKYINYMAHQKVYADRMYGFYKITPERIDFLLEVLDIQSYQHEEVYRDILSRWKEGDFSEAVEDHNRVWTLQNGDVGKATRLLTEEEEKNRLAKYE